MLRIISGKYRRRHISAPEGIRPTKDNIRENIFNVISQCLDNSKVLDLFAGSGSFGIEALSRGAGYAFFVDISKASTGAIGRNLKKIGAQCCANYDILLKDSLAAIRLLSGRNEMFDIIFLDPPYHGNLLKKCLKSLSVYDILQHSGIIIAEHFKKDKLPDETETLRIKRRLSYGDTHISIYTRR